MRDKELWYIHIPKCGGTSIKNALGIQTGHQTLKSKKDSLSKRDWENCFTVGFVRNPIDRMASFYRYLRKNKTRGLQDQSISFDEWIHLVFNEKNPTFRYREEYFIPCFDWLSLTGDTIDVDFVGRIESIDKDFKELCKILGVQSELEKLNSTMGTTSYNEDTKNIIIREFIRDIGLWYPNIIL